VREKAPRHEHQLASRMPPPQLRDMVSSTCGCSKVVVSTTSTRPGLGCRRAGTVPTVCLAGPDAQLSPARERKSTGQLISGAPVSQQKPPHHHSLQVQALGSTTHPHTCTPAAIDLLSGWACTDRAPMRRDVPQCQQALSAQASGTRPRHKRTHSFMPCHCDIDRQVWSGGSPHCDSHYNPPHPAIPILPPTFSFPPRQHHSSWPGSSQFQPMPSHPGRQFARSVPLGYCSSRSWTQSRSPMRGADADQHLGLAALPQTPKIRVQLPCCLCRLLRFNHFRVWHACSERCWAISSPAPQVREKQPPQCIGQGRPLVRRAIRI